MKKARVRVSGVTLSHSHTQCTPQTQTHTHTNPLQTKPPKAHLGSAAAPQGHTSKRDGLTNSPWQLINK